LKNFWAILAAEMSPSPVKMRRARASTRKDRSGLPSAFRFQCFACLMAGLQTLRPGVVRLRQLGRVRLGIALLPVRLGLPLADFEDGAVDGLSRDNDVEVDIRDRRVLRLHLGRVGAEADRAAGEVGPDGFAGRHHCGLGVVVPEVGAVDDDDDVDVVERVEPGVARTAPRQE
jgi:hypothetical protein